MKKIASYLTLKNIGIAFGGLLLIWMGYKFTSSPEPQETQVQRKEKSAQTIAFGEWRPESVREVLGTLQSSGDINIVSEINGTIAETFVRIGDEVEKGQLLALFQRFNDATQTAYENALRNLTVTKISSQNSVASAETSLQTALRKLEQTRDTEEQSYKQVFETLRTQARNSETVASNALDWADKILGASPRFRYQFDFTDAHIGNIDQVKKQTTKTMVGELVRQQDSLPQVPSFRPADADILYYAQERLKFLRDVQKVVRNMDDLIRRTTPAENFSISDRTAYKAEAESFSSKVDAEILSLESKIETAKTQNQNKRLSLVNAENAVKSAEASLDLARAQAGSSLSAAQSQVASASVSQSDLEVRAPFSGRITAKEISDFDQVNAGQPLFSIVSPTVNPKVVGYVTSDELDRILSASHIDIQLSNGNKVRVDHSFLSYKTDPSSQKIRVEFQLDTFPEGVLLGSFAKILVPTQNGKVNLVPITALSFEPDGAEVLILDSENIARRKKVQYGKIISDAVEILGGLEKGQKILKYRNRAHAGEFIQEIESSPLGESLEPEENE
ncbi:efflux RND transporter periplasmic adaptor subunit [Candidatus Gracilibacteria bacterium]|nr:efflux RND transporter periplasmic adaptor subunit [Candidatus Gracilibacteria bacterium]MCF7819260.1 efflux RND transporter periplasmic adaptor subunit [Candidatus Gracilibacteria bacterium]